jgi:hypothetical protein
VLDDFAVAHEKKVIVFRYDGPDLAEEDSHVFVTVALTSRMVVGWRTARGAVPARHPRLDTFSNGDALCAPPQDRRRRGRYPNAGGSRRCHVVLSVQPSFPSCTQVSVRD